MTQRIAIVGARDLATVTPVRHAAHERAQAEVRAVDEISEERYEQNGVVSIGKQTAQDDAIEVTDHGDIVARLRWWTEGGVFVLRREDAERRPVEIVRGR